MHMTQTEIWIGPNIAGIVLTGLLAMSCWCDVRTRRIPNALVLIGVVAGLMLNALVPAGLGFFSMLHPGGVGLLKAASGLFTGIGLFLPLYLMHGMGAGDVKLMGMVGAFVGPLSVIDAALATLVAGGVLAGAVALWNGTFSRAVENIGFMLIDSMTRGYCGQGIQLAPVHECAGRMPYALAIACGTLLEVLFLRNGYSVFAQ